MEDAERQQLGEAAWRVLERSGFEGFKVQLVLREAGVSARAFYRHFADKDELMMALLQEEVTRASQRTRALMEAADNPVDQVLVWIRSMLSSVTDPRRAPRTKLFSSQMTLMRRHAEQLDESRQLLYRPLEDAIARGADSGLFAWANPERDAGLVNALTTGKMTTALASGEKPDLDLLVEEISSFVLRALGLSPTS
jgi:AcrR family transcriptional regulator